VVFARDFDLFFMIWHPHLAAENMPHLILEYSDNLTSRMDVRAVLKTLHSTAQSSGLFPPASIRSRAMPCADFVVGEGTPRDAFMHLDVRIRPGRAEDLLWELARALMAVLKTAVSAAQGDGLRIGMTVEIATIAPVRVLYSTLRGEATEISAPA
jgi:5-carboxymethyl-2-hydroxymuconate isomerase